MNRLGRRTAGPLRLRGDQGAVIVEFAMVFPFLMLLSMGILEFGFMFRSNIIVSDTASSATRTLTNFGSTREADLNALLSGVAGLSALPDAAEVKRVVIFDADATQVDIDTCKTMTLVPGSVNGIDGVCNVYTWDAILAMDSGHINGVDVNGDDDCDLDDWDRRFCPTDRIDKIHNNLTRIGLYIDVEQKSLTKMFPWGSMQLDEQRIMHLAPDVGDE